MSKQYRLGRTQRMVNAFFAGLTGRGLGADYRHILSVAGRTSGEVRSNPVDVMDLDGSRWLVAPYGEVNWVKNVRAAGTVQLGRRRQVASYRAEEVGAVEAAPVIRRYVESVPVTRAYWDVTPTSTDEELVREAATHPVFRLTRIGT